MSILDNLNLDEVNLAFPVFDTTVLATCKEVKEIVEPAPAIVFTWQVEEPMTSTDGRQHPAGLTLTERINVSPEGGRTLEMIQQQLKRCFIALLGLKGDAKGVKWFDLTQYAGKQCKLLLKPRPNKDDPSVVYQDFKKHIAL